MIGTFIDLFCGGGGFSLGFKYAGWTHILGIDNWEIACQAYKMNVGDSKCIDIKKFDGTPYQGKVDLIIGSPPCQSFSNANVHTRTLDTSLCDEFMRVLQEIKPKYWIMENVPKLATCYEAPYKQVFQMTDYGLLQSRSRALLSSMHISAPILSQKMLSPIHIDKIKSFRPTSLRDPYPTLTCRYNSFTKITPSIRTHDQYHVMNHIEAMQLQTFPFFYEFPAIAKQRDIEMLIGNAVPPLFSFQIARYLAKNEAFPTFPKKRNKTLLNFTNK